MLEWISPVFVLLIFPNLLFICLSRMTLHRYIWYGGLVYTILCAGVELLRMERFVPDALSLGLQVLFLTGCGILFLKLKRSEAVCCSCVLVCVFRLTDGILNSLSFLVVEFLSLDHWGVLQNIDLLRNFDLFRNTAVVLLFEISFRFLRRHIRDSLRDFGGTVIALLVIPLFFIGLVEATVASAVYGDTMIWERNRGIVFPVVDSRNMLLLHLGAYIGMVSAFYAFLRLEQSIRDKQTIRLLEAQTQEQQIYVEEAQARCAQTTSLRHDLKNHFLVLGELLSKGKTEEAQSYLSDLQSVTETLSVPVHTNNATVDVLLGSKLMTARQNKIRTECELQLPDGSAVKDLDWCILLSNAVDNAIQANMVSALPDRYIRITGRRRGNLFLLHVANSCEEGTKLPVPGTGLANIQAVTQKYQGAVQTEVEDTQFRLDILLDISCYCEQRSREP